jgi:UPF0271 protein
MVRKVYVLDTSALIGGFSPGKEEAEQVTVPLVWEELREGLSRSRLETGLLEKKVKLLESPQEEAKEVERLVKKTGDRLSRTDEELLALALSLKKEGKEVEVITDDYGIQNLASLMGIPHRGLLMPGIRRVLRWSKVCPACGRKYPVKTLRCSSCGSELKKVGKEE